MTHDDLDLLPGVPAAYVRARLEVAGGDEIASGKFYSADSSAALAINAFAWFHEHPGRLPPLPGTEMAGWPALGVDVEYCARFPWAGGRHPWLDAFIETQTHIIGVESKRHEPFRDAKKVSFSDAYSRPVWGEYMGQYEAVRDQLVAGTLRFAHLDAAQLVKHAFGLVTESGRRGKHAILVYLYDEPSRWPAHAIALHRNETVQFSSAVGGAAVSFVALRWTEWLNRWPDEAGVLHAHAELLRSRFALAT